MNPPPTQIEKLHANKWKGCRQKLRCEFCEKQSFLIEVEIQHPTLTNTFTELKDIMTTIWKCPHCGCWQ
jgi:hypothetical protein